MFLRVRVYDENLRDLKKPKKGKFRLPELKSHFPSKFELTIALYHQYSYRNGSEC